MQGGDEIAADGPEQRLRPDAVTLDIGTVAVEDPLQFAAGLQIGQAAAADGDADALSRQVTLALGAHLPIRPCFPVQRVDRAQTLRQSPGPCRPRRAGGPCDIGLPRPCSVLGRSVQLHLGDLTTGLTQQHHGPREVDAFSFGVVDDRPGHLVGVECPFHSLGVRRTEVLGLQLRDLFGQFRRVLVQSFPQRLPLQIIDSVEQSGGQFEAAAGARGFRPLPP